MLKLPINAPKSGALTQAAMNLQELMNRPRITPPESAFRSDRIAICVLVSDRHPLTATLNTIGMVDEPQNQLCFFGQIKCLQRPEVIIVSPIFRNRHVHKLNMSGRCCANGISKGNGCGQRQWLDNMAVAWITVAKMNAALRFLFDETTQGGNT